MDKKKKGLNILKNSFSKVKTFPETEEEFFETLIFLAIMTESIVAQKLGYTGWGGISCDTKIDEETAVKEIQASPMFNIISLHLTHISENLKLGPHPEDGIEDFKKWFERTAQKYNSRLTYHKLFELVKKDRSIIV